jgi:DNA polymerase V
MGGAATSLWKITERPTTAAVPFALSQVPAGFPSPAEEYLDRPLDFNELLVMHPAATFAVKVTGDSMTGAGIYPGDIAVVDRALTATDGKIILAVLDGEFTIKRYRQKGGETWLQPENSGYKNIPLTEDSDFQVWGVIKNSIRMFA